MGCDCYDDAVWARDRAKGIVAKISAKVLGDSTDNAANGLNEQDVEDVAGAAWVKMYMSKRFIEYRLLRAELEDRGEVTHTYVSRGRKVTRRYTDEEELKTSILTGLIWLYAKRAFFDWLQERNSRRRFLAVDVVSFARANAVFIPDPQTEVVEKLARETTVRQIAEMVERWPPIEQLMFKLLFLRRISTAEARARLGMKMDRVHSMAQRMRSEVKTLYPAPDRMADADTQREYQVDMNLQAGRLETSKEFYHSQP